MGRFTWEIHSFSGLKMYWACPECGRGNGTNMGYVGHNPTALAVVCQHCQSAHTLTVDVTVNKRKDGAGGFTFDELRQEQGVWAITNFGGIALDEAYYALAEEVGELGHMLRVIKQHIREGATTGWGRLVKDAWVDIAVTHAGVANAIQADLGLDLDGALIKRVWTEVKGRDWKAHPVDAHKRAEAEALIVTERVSKACGHCEHFTNKENGATYWTCAHDGAPARPNNKGCEHYKQKEAA